MQSRSSGPGKSMTRSSPADRDTYPLYRILATRWADNDLYGHMNNVVHYELFDTAVNGFLIDKGLLDPHKGSHVFLVVETACRYFAEMAFPDIVHAGIRVAKLGTSSIRYEVGLFRNEERTAAAEGHFVHVQVDRETRRPVPLDEKTRFALGPLLALSV